MATTTRHHIEISRIDSSGNLFILYPKNTLKDVYTSSTSGVTIEGKVNFFGTCDTAANTAAKTVSISGFSLTAGAHLTVVFTNGISVASATLNVNGSGAKAIYFEGDALKANAVRAKARVHMVYDGSYFHVLSGASNAAYVTNANTTKFYLLGTPTNAAGSPGTEHFDTGVYVSATAGQLVATSFSGNGSALTNLNASNIASGTLAAARLATSGVTAGTYGPSANATLAASGTFTVPKVVTDAYGRVTGASNITYTLPADANTDTKVTNNVANTTKFYLVGSTSNADATGTLVKDTGVYVSTTEGQLVANTMQANTFYLGGTKASINSTDYTGRAATVKTISGYLVDSCASGDASGITTKALTANQGYLLQNQINTLNSKIESGNIEIRYDTETDHIQVLYNDTWYNAIYAGVQARYLYKLGDFPSLEWIGTLDPYNIKVTGGSGNYGTNPAILQNVESIKLYIPDQAYANGCAIYKNAVDVTKYSYLKVNVLQSEGYITFGLMTTRSADGVYAVKSTYGASGVLELDLRNITGVFYIGFFNIWGSCVLVFDKFWLE